MVLMNHGQYQALIEDTLTYIQNLLPKKEEYKVSSILLPPQTPPAPKVQLSPPKPKKPPLPKPLPPPLPQKNEEVAKTFIELIPPPPSQNSGVSHVLSQIKQIEPDLFLHQDIPSDFAAKRIKSAWKEKRTAPAIPILFQGEAYRSLLANIAKAIDTTYGSSRLVEVKEKKQWDLFLESENLKLIIAPDALIFETKELLPFYKENPGKKTKTLGNIPLLLLPDLSLYYKDPYLKRALWNVIKSTLN